MVTQNWTSVQCEDIFFDFKIKMKKTKWLYQSGVGKALGAFSNS